jgi:hypothetical protein
MKKRRYICLLLALIIFLPTTGCFIYSEQSFKGTVLDIDTKQPIKGAVVVAEYNKAYISLGAGQVDYTMDVRETLTDKDGNFHFPAHVALSSPISTQIPTVFLIFKPGYASLKLRSKFFTGEEIKEEEGSLSGLNQLKYRVRGRGIVEIPKLKTKKEMLERSLGFPVGYGTKELPLLYRAYEDELRTFEYWK